VIVASNGDAELQQATVSQDAQLGGVTRKTSSHDDEAVFARDAERKGATTL
jgi:hypothetical protein